MSSLAQTSSVVARASRAVLAGAGLLVGSLGFASTVVAPAATVLRVEPTRIADLVLLDGGFNAGLREDMVCRITRAGRDVAEVLLVDVRPACSSALILNVTPGQSIRSGDGASLKILKT